MLMLLDTSDSAIEKHKLSYKLPCITSENRILNNNIRFSPTGHDWFNWLKKSSICIPFSTNRFCAGLVPFHPLFRLAFVSLTKMGRLGVRWTSSITDTFSGKTKTNDNTSPTSENSRRYLTFNVEKSGTSRKIGSPLQVQIHYTNQPIVGWHLIISNHPILETGFQYTSWKCCNTIWVPLPPLLPTLEDCKASLANVRSSVWEIW